MPLGRIEKVFKVWGQGQGHW